MSRCLYCYKELGEGMTDFHPACARKFSVSARHPNCLMCGASWATWHARWCAARRP